MNPGTPELVPSELVSLLQRQCAIFAQLRELSERQRGLVVQDDPQPLLSLLADRQRLVDDLSRCNVRLAPFRRRWTDVLTSLAPAARAEIGNLLLESDRILGSILERDQQDATALGDRQRRAARALVQKVEIGRAVKGYAAGSAGETAAGTDATA